MSGHALSERKSRVKRVCVGFVVFLLVVAVGVFTNTALSSEGAEGLELTQPECPYTGETMIDVSHVDSGYVSISGKGSRQMRVQITHNADHKDYTVIPDGYVRNYPLTFGNGSYQVELFEQKQGDLYVRIALEQFEINEISDIAPYSIPHVMCWYDEQSFGEVAQSITSESETDQERAEDIVLWVKNNIRYDHEQAKNATSIRYPDLVESFSSKQGICLDRSSAVAALLRSIGIPTQIVTGYIGDGSYHHAWNRVYLEGEWVDMDMENLLDKGIVSITAVY